MKAYCKPRYEVADILNQYGQDFRDNRKLHVSSHKVMGAIQTCRTSVLGGHIDRCTDCKYQRNAYNSCRNRHCPKCQGMNQLKWVDKRAMDLLPVNYFHLVFTIPHQLNKLCLINKKVLYTILFKAAAETVTMLAQDKKHLGATVGITSVLHSWGQNLMEHPHVHMIVTGGGVNQQTGQWTKSRKKFFIPVRVLSRVFRGKFLSKLKDAYNDDQLLLVGRISELQNIKHFKALLNTLYEKQWVVYAKKPFGNSASVLKYLGRYTHRIAISNHRIVNIDKGKVAFKWKDYADKNKQKVITIHAGEFIRRFLLHVLPKAFCKIRYYGIIANRNRKTNLAAVRKQFNVAPPINTYKDESWQELLHRLTGFNVNQCPKCKKETMQTLSVLQKQVPI